MPSLFAASVNGLAYAAAGLASIYPAGFMKKGVFPVD